LPDLDTYVNPALSAGTYWRYLDVVRVVTDAMEECG
jgi:hypothetical protein